MSDNLLRHRIWILLLSTPNCAKMKPTNFKVAYNAHISMIIGYSTANIYPYSVMFLIKYS